MSGLLDVVVASHYQPVIDAWADPYGAPIIERVALDDGRGTHVLVVRDDLLGYGSKIRFIDCLVGHYANTQHVQEWVFGSCPATGYAQISLGFVCKRYGKKAVLFMAERKKLHPYQQKGLELGVDYQWAKFGRLNVTESYARRYAQLRPLERRLLPIGLEHPLVSLAITKVASGLTIAPQHVWSVGSSGSLNRGLQAAWPDAEVHVVSVGHSMDERERGRAQLHLTRYAFDAPVSVDDTPPFPSAPTYDAKCWHVMREWYREHPFSGNILFWNVGA